MPAVVKMNRALLGATLAGVGVVALIQFVPSGRDHTNPRHGRAALGFTPRLGEDDKRILARGLDAALGSKAGDEDSSGPGSGDP
jgi:hypothetical protein